MTNTPGALEGRVRADAADATRGQHKPGRHPPFEKVGRFSVGAASITAVFRYQQHFAVAARPQGGAGECPSANKAVPDQSPYGDLGAFHSPLSGRPNPPRGPMMRRIILHRRGSHFGTGWAAGRTGRKVQGTGRQFARVAASRPPNRHSCAGSRIAGTAILGRTLDPCLPPRAKPYKRQGALIY